MSFSLTDARFRLARALGLFRRTWASLHTRGGRATWERIRTRMAKALRPSTPPSDPLWRPEPMTPDTFAPFSLPRSDAPRVSIIIPVYGQLTHTLACLRSLSLQPPHVAAEVLVVDDSSSDSTPTLLPRIDGLRYLRREHNGGFIAACNDGAAAARGDMLVFLNNDTVPQPGWLEMLLETFTAVPDVGLVGAQLLYPDGRLQEAGGTIFSDGNAWNYGRFENPDDPRFGYVRETDYASGAAIAITAELFHRLGGFDRRYAPAYYEDAALAFAVRKAGLKVLYQPRARVLHDEGTSAGTDLSTGMKAAQIRNRDVFARHYADALSHQLSPRQTPSPASLHRNQRQILIVDESTPRPDHDSGSLRLVTLMHMLIDDGAHVVFVPADGHHAGHHTRALQARGIETWYAPFLGGLARWVERNGARFDVAMLSRHFVAAPLIPLLRKHAPKTRILFDSVDLHYVRERRSAEVHADPAMLAAAVRTRSRELAVIAQADVTLVVSTAESRVLAEDAPDAQVRLLSNLHVAGDGGPDWSERDGVVFVGGFAHPPNVDAMRWFLDRVWPLVRLRLPALAFHCIGNAPPDTITAHHGHNGVHVHGHVPDLTAWMEGCRVAVAPLRFGAGVKGKINLSMAQGQPVVATTIAAEGMHLLDGHDVLLADDAEQFAEAIVRLHEDRDLWKHLSERGLDNVNEHFSTNAARDVVQALFLAPR